MRASLTGLSKSFHIGKLRGNGNKELQKLSKNMDHEMGTPQHDEISSFEWCYFRGKVTLMAEYLAGLPEPQREESIIKALGVGILAEIKGEIAQFLNETEGEIGKRLANLKALYELREMRYLETSSKGLDAEQKILQALKDIQVTSAFSDDEITDLSTVRGVLPRIKTGDLLIEVDGQNDVTIGLEIKLDKGVKLGRINNRDPAAQTDTAIEQLLEMRTNRETDANAIVFDEDSMDATVAAACPNGIKYVQAISFVVIVNTR
jgi:hypothetical protein